MKSTLLISALLLLASCGGSSEPKMSEAELDALAEAEVESMLKKAEYEEMKEAFQWKYSTDTDEMTSKTTKYAQVTSDDVAMLESPYDGGVYLTLHLRNTEGDHTAFIKTTKGQLHTEYNNPSVVVRFNNNEPVAYNVVDAADGDSEYLFFNNTSGFIKNLKEADSVKIQVMYYNNGNHVFTFNTKDLKW